MGSAELARPGETGGHSVPTPTPVVRPDTALWVSQLPLSPRVPRSSAGSRRRLARLLPGKPAQPVHSPGPCCSLVLRQAPQDPTPWSSSTAGTVLCCPLHPPALPCPPCRCPLRGPPGSLPDAHQAALFGCPGRILTLSSWGSRPRGCPWQAGGALSVFGVSGHPTCLSGSQAGLQRMPAASPGEAAGSLGGEDRGQRWRRLGPGPVVLLLA